jgi:ABC-type antimicrobial peptide transport system permease subunit
MAYAYGIRNTEYAKNKPMILKNLIRRPMRTVLTLLGIAIGVAAVVALGAMAQGMLVNYGSAVGVSNDLLVIQADALDPLFSALDDTFETRIQAVPGVENADPGVYAWIATDEMPFFLVYGYEPHTPAMAHYRIVAGKPITGPKQIALGGRAAESLKKGVDDTVRLYGVPYRVVGIYETGQGMEESGGVVTLADAQDIAGKPRKVSLYQVGLRRNADVDQVVRRIESLDKTLSANKASEYNATEQWTSMLTGFAWGIAAIAIIIGGLGMMNAMAMSVMERTREIGTLRALGWSRGRVVRMIMGESLVLSVLGGLVGIALGVGMTELAAATPGIGAFLEGIYSPGIFIQGMVTALLLGVLGGAYPARRAANLLPVEALRYEGGGSGEGSKAPRVGGQAFRNLWRRRTRTLLSATGIGIGVATLVALGGMSKGVLDQLNMLAGSSGAGNISIMQRKVADLSLSTLDERMVSEIQAMPGIKAVSPFLMGFIMTADMPFFLIGGVDPNSAAMSHYQLIDGHGITRPNEVLLGKTAAKNYKLGVGDTLTLFGNRYRVAGIFETGVAYEDGGGMLALREAQRLLNRPRSLSFIFVDVVNPGEAKAVVAALERRYPEALVALSSEFAQRTDSRAQLDAMTGAIGLLAMLVGAIVVANTMMMSVYERTREIGTLRALGWPKRRILGEVVQETLWLCLLAGLLGSLTGVLMMWGATKIPLADTFMAAGWDVQIFAQAVGMALLVGVIAGLYPAWRASRLQPVEALRYE